MSLLKGALGDAKADGAHSRALLGSENTKLGEELGAKTKEAAALEKSLGEEKSGRAEADKSLQDTHAKLNKAHDEVREAIKREMKWRAELVDVTERGNANKEAASAARYARYTPPRLSSSGDWAHLWRVQLFSRAATAV